MSMLMRYSLEKRMQIIMHLNVVLHSWTDEMSILQIANGLLFRERLLCLSLNDNRAKIFLDAERVGEKHIDGLTCHVCKIRDNTSLVLNALLKMLAHCILKILSQECNDNNQLHVFPQGLL